MSPETPITSSQNKLLQALSAEDFALLQPHLSRVRLAVRDVLEARDQPIEQVFFLESAIGSNVASADHDGEIEVGLFGREGMSGIPVVLGEDRWFQECFVQIAGEGLRIGSDNLRRATQSSASLQQLLLRYVQAMMIQTANTAYANGHGKVEARLARWLLMVHDRMDGDEVPLTHEFLALMLGVRRPGVTEALHVLEGRQAIRTARSLIVVTDRARLEESAAGLYGVSEREYKRLIG
jgi:CRP-like cAMP-binding protein